MGGVSRSVTRVAAVLVGVVMVGGASACDGSGGDDAALPAFSGAAPPGATTSSGGGGDGWRRVPLPGTVRSLVRAQEREVVVAGDDAGRPLLAAVTGASATPLPLGGPPAPERGLVAADGDGERLVLAEGPPARPAARAALWSADYPPLRDPVVRRDVPVAWRRDELRDAAGRPASWLRPMLDSEEDYRAVGAVRHGAGWSLHAWMVWDTWRPLDRGEQLWVHGAPEALLTATTETTVVVAGAVSDSPGGPARPQAWSLPDTLFEEPDAPGRWTPLPMPTPPDALTDVASWSLGWWVAGHRRLRPVVYDYDSLAGPPGRELPVPDTRLDPRHPVVLVAGTPVTSAMVLATQSVEGPVVWVDSGVPGTRRWTRVAAPPGVLSAAVTVPGGVYLVLDGALWYHPVEVPAIRRG